jgi:hypothetical protein
MDTQQLTTCMGLCSHKSEFTDARPHENPYLYAREHRYRRAAFIYYLYFLSLSVTYIVS